MRRRGRRVLLVGVALAVVVGAVLVVLTVVDRAGRSRLDEALRAVPEDALRIGFTDWSAVRRVTGEPDDQQLMLDEAWERDLSAASAMSEGAAAQQEHLGFSPGVVDWEAFVHGPSAVALVLRLDDAVDPDDVRSALRESGFRRPSFGTGTWRADTDLLSGLDADLDSQFKNVVVLDDQRTIVTSDSPEYAEEVSEVVRGEGDSVADAADTDALTGSIEDPVVSASVWPRDTACEELALSQGGPDDAARGAAVVEQAGGVGPITGLLMARHVDQRLVVVERYEDERRARKDLKARATLAVGEAVGRGGSFSDDFELLSSRTHGANVVLTLRGREDNQFLLSTLQSGPVIFAAC